MSRRRWRGVHVLESAASCRLYSPAESRDDGRPLPAGRRAEATAPRRADDARHLAVPAALDAQRLLQVWAAMSSAG